MKFTRQHRPVRRLGSGEPPNGEAHDETPPSEPETQATPAAESPAPPPRKPRGKPRGRAFRIFRFTTRTLFLLLLIAIALVCLLLFYPWSLALFARRIESRLLAATGLGLHYAAAHVRLVDGVVTIDAPQLFDPASGTPLLNLESIRVELPFNQLMFGGAPYEISNIELVGPLTLECAMVRGTPRLIGPARRALDLLQAHRQRLEQTHNQTAAPFVLRRVALAPLNILVWDQPAEQAEGTTMTQSHAGALPEAPPEIVMSMQGGALDADFEQTLRPHHLWLQTPAGLRISVRPDFDARQVAYSVRMEQFDSLKLPWTLPLHLAGEQLDLHGSAHMIEEPVARPAATTSTLAFDGDWQTSGRLALTRARLGRVHGESHPLGNLAVAWDVAGPGHPGEIEVRSVQLTARDVALRTSGTLGNATPFPYHLRIGEAQLAGAGAALAAEPFIEHVRLLKPEMARVRLTAAVTGTLKRRVPAAIQGTLEWRGLDCASSELPEQLLDMEGRAEFTTRTLKLGRARLRYAGFPLELSGEANGAVLQQAVERVQIQWKTAGRLEGLQPMLARLGPHGLSLSGPVASEGTLRLERPAAGKWLPLKPGELLREAKLRGMLEFKGATVRYPPWGEALEGLTGIWVADQDQVRLRRTTGRLAGQVWSLEGNLAGQGNFWKEPRLTGSATVQVDLAKLPELGRMLTKQLAARQATPLTERMQAVLARLPEATGQGALQFNFNGPLRAWRTAEWDAGLEIKQLRTNLTPTSASEALELDHLIATGDLRGLTLNDVRGRWGALTFSGGLNMAPAGGELNLTLDGPYAAYKQRMPFIFKWFIVDGHLHTQHRSTFVAADGAAAGQTWTQWWTELQRRGPIFTSATLTGERLGPFRTQHRGTVRLRDVEMTFYSMPAWLRHATTTMQYDEHRLWSPEAFSVDGGPNSHGLRGTLELVYPRKWGDLLQFNFRVTEGHFSLTDWLQPWHGNHHDESAEPRVPFDPNEAPYFAMRGDFNTDSMELWGLQGKQVSGTLRSFEYHEQSSMVRWDDIHGTLYGGKFNTSGVSHDGLVQADMTGEQISMPELMAVLAPDSKSSGGLDSGLVTGKLHLEHQSGDTPPSPLRGSGEIKLVKSRFISNKIFRSLGGLLKLPLFEDITFSTIQGPFKVEGDRYSTPGMTFENPVVYLLADGTAGPNRQLDLNMKVQFLGIVDRVPILGEAMDILNKLAGKVLQFKVRGTRDNPEIRPF